MVVKVFNVLEAGSIRTAYLTLAGPSPGTLLLRSVQWDIAAVRPLVQTLR
jgi:hypothetical protein